jgi:hypothetical protein
MAERVEHTREISDLDGTTSRTTQVVEKDGDVRPAVAEQAHGQAVVTRIVWYVAGILLVLLGSRFVLVLLGANPSNGFANFIYSASHPFVAPFFGLFSYDLRYGVSRFETFTLVAMAVYALIALAIARLININRPAEQG